jgi:hypothetical protein
VNCFIFFQNLSLITEKNPKLIIQSFQVDEFFVSQLFVAFCEEKFFSRQQKAFENV